MNESGEISDLVAGMLLAIDRLDWATVRRAFAERVAVDYTSLFGGQAAELSADDLIKNWQGLLPGFDATQHLIGPVVISETAGRTVAGTSVRGYHYIKDAPAGAIWMVAGQYTFSIERTGSLWRIAGITLTLAYQEGNLGMPGLAQQRVAAGSTRR
ncbi:MAG: nuclear transport factor 2 family protein [Nibricoccus sp.]